MNIQDLLRTLGDNRLMENQEQVLRFEAALEQFANHPQASEHLRELHLVLDDKTQHGEVMYGLIHLLESFRAEQQLVAFIDTLPSLTARAPEWVKTLTYRILNDEYARSIYKRAFLSSTGASKALIQSLLTEIQQTDPSPLSAHARDVLMAG
jgi:hypothetical protein